MLQLSIESRLRYCPGRACSEGAGVNDGGEGLVRVLEL